VKEAVVDASVSIKCLAPEEGSEQAATLFGTARLHAPTWWRMEMGNILWKKARKQEIPKPLLPGFLKAVLKMPVECQDDDRLLADGLEIASLLDHPYYDCLYLALAVRMGVPLVTADRRLAALNGKIAGADIVNLSDLRL
jgi:predicted nucleic acid-binding protein